MKRIYTRTGDKGMTGIHGGERVPKDDIRIEANGTLDELNAVLGIVRTLLPAEDSLQEDLHCIQRDLMTVMSLVATPSAKRDSNPNSLPQDLVSGCEAMIDRLTEQAGTSEAFLLPGGTPAAAHLQLARTVSRRAERHLWTLHRQDPLPEDILQYVNRLSDLFFTMARLDLQRQGWPEERWQAFAYKRKSGK